MTAQPTSNLDALRAEIASLCAEIATEAARTIQMIATVEAQRIQMIATVEAQRIRLAEANATIERLRRGRHTLDCANKLQSRVFASPEDPGA